MREKRAAMREARASGTLRPLGRPSAPPPAKVPWAPFEHRGAQPSPRAGDSGWGPRGRARRGGTWRHSRAGWGRGGSGEGRAGLGWGAVRRLGWHRAELGGSAALPLFLRCRCLSGPPSPPGGMDLLLLAVSIATAATRGAELANESWRAPESRRLCPGPPRRQWRCKGLGGWRGSLDGIIMLSSYKWTTRVCQALC